MRRGATSTETATVKGVQLMVGSPEIYVILYQKDGPVIEKHGSYSTYGDFDSVTIDGTDTVIVVTYSADETMMLNDGEATMQIRWVYGSHDYESANGTSEKKLWVNSAYPNRLIRYSEHLGL